MIKHVSGLRLYFPKRKKQQKQTPPNSFKDILYQFNYTDGVKNAFF